jgi:hypothetical protein
MKQKMKVCFVTEAHQLEYVNQFNCKIKKLHDILGDNFHYYVSTNLPNKIDNSYKNLKIFDLCDLQERSPKTKQYENLNDKHVYHKYPWNLRRHIICKSFEDGFDYVIWTDCDVIFKKNVTYKRLIELLNKLDKNTIYTDSVIWKFNNEPQKVFNNYEKVFKDLNLKFDKNDMITHDGPTAIYYLDNEHQKKFIEKWDFMVGYGYESRYWGDGNWFIPNLIYAILMSGIKVKALPEKIFIPQHNEKNRIY